MLGTILDTRNFKRNLTSAQAYWARGPYSWCLNGLQDVGLVASMGPIVS